MLKRELRRYTEKYSKLLEPFALLLLVIIFVLPVITVLNLSPKTAPEKFQSGNSVLGIQDTSAVTVQFVGGFHSIIKSEALDTKGINLYQYSAVLTSRAAGNYSKPILKIINGTNSDVTVSFSGGTVAPSTGVYGILINDNNYILQDSNGTTYIHKQLIPKNATSDIYLSLKNTDIINFEEQVQINIVVE